MVLGTFPTKAGIPSWLHQSGDVYLQNVEAWCSVYVSVSACVCVCVYKCVCVVKGDPRLSWLRLGIGGGGGEDTIRPWFLWLWWHPDNSRRTHRHAHTQQIHMARVSLLLRARHHRPLTHLRAHTETQTHTPESENYSLACKRWADGLPNDCCVQCRGSMLLSHYTSPLQLDPKAQVWLSFTLCLNWH